MKTFWFRYTNFIVVIFFLTPLTLGIFFLAVQAVKILSAFLFQVIFDISRVRTSLSLVIVITFFCSFYIYEKWLFKIAEKKGIANVYENRIEFKFGYSNITILISDILSIHYKPCLGSWYGLIIKTKKGKKIKINESMPYCKSNVFVKNSNNSPLHELYKFLYNRLQDKK